MTYRGSVGAGLLAGVVLLAGVRSEAAGGTVEAAKNELMLFGGTSILDLSRTQETTIPEVPGPPGFPGIPETQFRTETSLGGSVLFGARYSRYLKGRLAVEVDLAVAPAHDYETVAQLCPEGVCLEQPSVEPASGEPFPGGLGLEDLRTRNLTAWHYGAGLAYDITGGDVRPVVIFGAGGVSYSGAQETSTDFVLRFGAGVKVLFGRVGARVEVVDHLVTKQFLSGHTEHDIHATAGFVVRF